MPSACRRAGRGRTASSRGQPCHLATACRDHAIPFDAGAADTGGSAPIRLEHTMDSLFNRNTNSVASNESGTTGATSQHAASDAPAAVVNPLYAGEPVGESATLASSPAATSDACVYVAEPAPQQVTPTKECDGKQPGRATNLLLVAADRAACRAAGHRTVAPRTRTVPPTAAKAPQAAVSRADRRPRVRPVPAVRTTLRQTARPATQTEPRAMRLQARAMALPPRRLPFPPSHPRVHIERHDHD